MTFRAGIYALRTFKIQIVVLLIFSRNCQGEGEDIPDAVVRVNRLSDQVRAVLEHYKSPDPVGLPGFPIPDPLPLPEIKKSITWGTSLSLTDQRVCGLSKFRIESADSNLADMEVFIALRINHLEVMGNYTLTTLFSHTKGASNSTFTNLYGEGSAKLKVAKEGYLEATNIDLDISVDSIDVNFENPGLLGSVLQGTRLGNIITSIHTDRRKDKFLHTPVSDHLALAIELIS